MSKHITLLLLLLATTAAAQVPSVTATSELKLREGNNTWFAPVWSLLATLKTDSTWALAPGGGYAGKRINSNVYRTGKVSLNTTDTTGQITIGRDSASATPAIVARYGDASNGAFNFFSIQPISQTGNGGGLLGNFNFWATNFPGVNVPYSSRANHVWRWGYNVGGGGGRIIATDASLEDGRESNFYNVGLDGVRRRQWEAHLQSQDTNGVVHRVFTANGSHNGAEGGVGFNSDGFYFSRYNNLDSWLTVNRFAKTFILHDSMPIIFEKNGVGAGGIFQRNAANTSNLNLMYADASDRIVNGGTGVTSVYMPAGKLDIAGTGEIYNTSGHLLTVGTASAPTTLRVNANGSEALTLKSVAGGSNAWSTYVNSSAIVYARPDGNAFIEAYTNAPYTVWANNKIGIGTNLDSRLSITQIGNGAQGGIGLVNLSGITSYLQTNGSGNFSYIDNAGASKFEVGTDGAGFGGAPISGWRLYSNGAFRADGAITSRGTGTSSALLLNNTTASTGKEWYINSVNSGDLVVGNPTTADAITINGTTGATTIGGPLTITNSTGSAATVTGRTSGGVVTNVTIGSGLSLSGGTLSATGGGGGNYQTLRENGTDKTQRAAANFVSTATVAAVLTDDAGNGETEIALNIPDGAIQDEQLAATGVTAGTYTNSTVTIDADGRVTAASNGPETDVQTFTSSGTWTKPAGAKAVEVTVVGGGGGGGGGAGGGSGGRYGGGGGGGGGRSQTRFDAASLSATEAVTVGSGGPGGDGSPGGSGSSGSPGGASNFGNLLLANGGNFGGGGVLNSTAGASGIGGTALISQGASGGAGNANNGGASNYSSTGGGGGAQLTSGGAQAAGGSAGVTVNYCAGSSTFSNNAGAAASNGGNGSSLPIWIGQGGGGGGSNASGVGGSGGDGGGYGGGGGGGGGGINGGNGGDGAPGIVVVITYF